MQNLLEGKVIKDRFKVESMLFQEKDLICFKGKDLADKIPVQILIRSNLKSPTSKLYDQRMLSNFEKLKILPFILYRKAAVISMKNSVIVVTEPVGPTVHKMLQTFKNNFCNITIYLLAIEMLNMAEVLQKERIVCRSFHPKNLYTHLDPRKKSIFFLSMENFHMMKERGISGKKPLEDFSAKGKVSFYMSLGEHFYLKSIGYMMIHFISKAKFFRTKTKKNDIEEYEEFIKNRKLSILPEGTLRSYPDCIKEYFVYIKKLGITDKPDIDFIRNKFILQIRKESIVELDQLTYTWTSIIMDTLQARIRENERVTNHSRSDLITAVNTNSEDDFNVNERDSDFFRPVPRSFAEYIRFPYAFSTE